MGKTIVFFLSRSRLEENCGVHVHQEFLRQLYLTRNRTFLGIGLWAYPELTGLWAYL